MSFLNNKIDINQINNTLDTLNKLNLNSTNEILNYFNIVITEDESIIDNGYYVFLNGQIFVTISPINNKEAYTFLLMHLIGHALMYGTHNKIYVCKDFTTTNTSDGMSANIFATDFLYKVKIKKYYNFIKFLLPQVSTAYRIKENCDF